MPDVAPDLVLLSRRAVLPDGVRPAAVAVAGERITAVVAPEAIPAAWPTPIDLGDLALLPGLVDPHVHLNEPGRAEWEGFETGTRAAAAGGITTVVDMPLNSSPVTTTVAALEAKRRLAEERSQVDCFFHAGLIPGNLADLEPLIDTGVVGVKAFLVHSGIDEFPNASEADLRAAMPLLARRGVPLLVHAEIESCPAPSAQEARRYADYLASRPAEWEIEAIRMVLGLCAETGCRVHIVHLSAAGALPLLAEARRAGLPVTVETAPHYLYFDAESIPDGDTRYKCAPPIRAAANREMLWQALRAGQIDLIASDHSPCPPEMKGLEAGDFGAAWGGIASLQLGLPVVWTEASARGFTLADVAAWMAERSARSVGLQKRKGAIAPGRDADLVVFDPEAEITVAADRLFHRHPVTPYDGRTLRGVVRGTYVRGALVYDNRVFPVRG